MRIIFIGQAPFGAETLEALITQGEQIAGVITIPDQPGQKYPNPVKEAADKHGCAVLQTKLLKHPDALSFVADRSPDLLVLAFVTSFVPKDMIESARHGGINYHPSLLPKYRGGSAINWAVINGERETGVTIHFIDEGVDTGPILLQKKVPITPDDTVKTLYFKKLYPLGVAMLCEAVRLIRTGEAQPVAQDESQASFKPVITADDTIINWQADTVAVHNLIRGADPSPGASSCLRGHRYRLYDATIGSGSGEPGTIIAITGNALSIATGNGAVDIATIQPPGAKKQPVTDVLQDMRLGIGDRFTDASLAAGGDQPC